MRVCHFSDWHWNYEVLPAADLYVCTGDMYDNYPKVIAEEQSRPYGGATARKWGIVAAWEREKQKEAADIVADRIPAIFKNSPDSPLICVRGNHDFTDLRHIFAKCPNFLHEFMDNEMIEVLGLKVTGHRGIPAINGSWSDELDRYWLNDRMRAMPLADLYLTHYPPYGVLDSSRPPGTVQDGAEKYGMEGMSDFLLYRSAPALHCFGHIHEWGGETVTHGVVTFSNAATGYNLLELNGTVWKDISPL